jgi:hypothetical protein
LEFEADLAFHGEVLKTCPRCGIQTHRRQCPECEIKLTGDAEMDQVMADIEAGKEVEDLDALLRPGRKPDEQFEPVKPGEMP